MDCESCRPTSFPVRIIPVRRERRLYRYDTGIHTGMASLSRARANEGHGTQRSLKFE